MAIIARATGDLDLAEDAVQDAFATALVRWERDGEPRNQTAWIVATARNRAIDLLRRRSAQSRAIDALGAITPLITIDDHDIDEPVIPDERLALVFACCHPALAIEAQVALTLRLVAGLTTPQIARAFLVPEPTMAQRLVRAKTKVRDAGIPVAVPDADALPGRRDAVLTVVYLVFNEGYSSLDGEATAGEAIRLGRLMVELVPDDAEAHGLLALMLLQESRRSARRDAGGDLVLLREQDRSLWDRAAVAEGMRHLERSMGLPERGPYQLQAAIAACHAAALRDADTDWRSIVALYGALARMTGSPVVELNRAVALSMAGRPEAALSILDRLADELAGYHALHAARADVLRQLGRDLDATDAYRRAAELAPTEEERRFLAAQQTRTGRD